MTGRLGRTGFWSILDHGLFAASNFGVNLLLARWLPEAAYGAFAVAYATLFLPATLQTALITEPMLIFGPSRFAGSMHAYVRQALAMHMVFVTASSVVIGAIGWLVIPPAQVELRQAFVVAMGMAPLVLSPWLLRRTFYATLTPQWAALGGAAYLLVVGGSLTLVVHLHALTALTAIGVIGAASAASAVLLYGLVHWTVAPDHAPQPPVAEVLRLHAGFGGWGLAAALLTWAIANVYIYELPLAAGLAETARLRARLNFVTPMTQVNAAIGVALLPSLVAVRGSAAFMHRLRSATLAIVGLSVAAWAVLAVAEPWLTQLVYGARYAGAPRLLWLLGAWPVIEGMNYALGSALRSIERPRVVVRCSVVTALTAVPIGMVLAWKFGAAGAIVGLLLASGAMVATMALALWQERRGSEPVAQASVA